MANKLSLLGYDFKPKTIPALVTVLLLPILISLGLWQLDRAEQKRIIDNEIQEAIKKPAFSLARTDLKEIKQKIYQKVRIRGRYESKKQFLLDNRTYKGIPGYQVLTPFIFKHANNDSHAVLINRGWIKYTNTRDNIADIRINNTQRSISGTVKDIPASITLDERGSDISGDKLKFKAKDKTLDNVYLLQEINLEQLENLLGYSVLPIIIELDKSAEDGFTRDWKPYFGSIDKHNAYALQWFAMAGILFFLFIKLNLKKIKKD